VVVRIDLATIEEGSSSFEYENIPIPCKACGAETNYLEIEYDPIGLKEELEVTRCPQCGTHNSFEFELEEFDERYIQREYILGDTDVNAQLHSNTTTDTESKERS
jgi:hypothetical protein